MAHRSCGIGVACCGVQVLSMWFNLPPFQQAAGDRDLLRRRLGIACTRTNVPFSSVSAYLIHPACALAGWH